MRGVIAQAEAGLSLAQRFRIARARSQRLLAREWDESKHPRVPAGSGDPSGQFAESGSEGIRSAASLHCTLHFRQSVMAKRTTERMRGDSLMGFGVERALQIVS